MSEIRARQNRNSSGNGDNIVNDNNTNGIASGSADDPDYDPMDKEALNARLSDRRRERRQQRLKNRGTTATTASGIGGGGTTVTGTGTTTTTGTSSTSIGLGLGSGGGGVGVGGGGVLSAKRKTVLSSKSKRHGSGYRTRSMLVMMIIFIVFGVFGGIWMAGFYYVTRMNIQTNNANNVNNANSSNNNRNMLRSAAKAAVNAIALVGNPNEIIDMRQLNRILPFDNPDGGAWKQGWDVQPVPILQEDASAKPLKIFVVPHSHCDPGWIKTFDEYFQSQTKNILTSVVQSLAKQPKRRFIWAEISYFEWWWKEQDASTQQLLRRLLYDGQFEFVTGGWVQPDEANTQLYAMEIQLQEGHDFIRETFGEEYIPKFGWSIDPFGYSPTMAYLLNKYQFKGMLIQRVHYAIKKELALHQQLEFMWRQTWDDSPNGDHDIFTHVMPFYSYDVPHTCGPDPSVCCQFDFARLPEVAPTVSTCPWRKAPKKIHDRNVEERALLLLDQYRKKAALYRSNVVIAPLGDDFRYQSLAEADMQFENYQRIFDYINENVKGVEIQFGTLSEYFTAAMGTFEPPILKGSFFTYSDRDEDYWSGYFTSRIFDKALDRQLERLLYAATSMGASKIDLREQRRALSLFQHHDGVTGTAKDHVVLDYAARIHKAIRDVQDWMIQHHLKHFLKSSSSSFFSSHNAQIHPCWQSDSPRGLLDNHCGGEGSPIIVYNPLNTPQSCGDIVVKGLSQTIASFPCDVPGALPNSKAGIQFDPETGLMIHPVKEEWMKWSVNKGGAYLFFPHTVSHFTDRVDWKIEQDGYVVGTPSWKRTVTEREVPDEFGNTAIVIDFEYETFLQLPNKEWFVRFSADIANEGVFHTDLNGYNFDTHYFRKDMPIQSQVFPMPTHASIEDDKQRLTVLSEHAQGTASLEEGSMDIWLDRRLMQDDDRGLGQGVRDNVPTRTRLRVVLEKDGYNHDSPEFTITPLCKLLWKQLNHPLEMFGIPANGGDVPPLMELPNDEKGGTKQVSPARALSYNFMVPVVFMVYNRVDYFKEVIDSLRNSDYPRDSVPIIVSHDGHIDDMVSFVDSIKSEFKVIQLFHPHACSEHPFTFPGNDPKLNVDYPGDTYGNPRDGKITCCKHHFTWLMTTVFALEEVKDADGFFFMEEDYVVAPTFYESLQTGFGFTFNHPHYFGVTLDSSEGWSYVPPKVDHWITKRFVTGPMSLDRSMFEKIKEHATDYCTFDDYNWDWSLVHLISLKYLPATVVVPGRIQVAHIGIQGGLHQNTVDQKKIKIMQMNRDLEEFHAKFDKDPWDNGGSGSWLKKHVAPKKGYGGWGHPADHEHCLKLFGSEPPAKSIWSLFK